MKVDGAVGSFLISKPLSVGNTPELLLEDDPDANGAFFVCIEAVADEKDDKDFEEADEVDTGG